MAQTRLLVIKRDFGMLLVLILVAALLSAQKAYARDWPVTGGWTVFEGDTFCGMSLEYEGKGETELLVGHELDGSVILIVSNYGWSAKKGASYEINFYLGEATYGGGKALGSEVDGRKGFTTKFDAEFWKNFKSASSFRIVIGGTLIDHLNLSGTAAAGAVVDRCLLHVRGLRAAEERERKRFAHIPDDPFAAAKSDPTPPRIPAASITWISNDDYPAASLRAREQGIVKVQLDVTIEGRVNRCTVTASSGYPLLDSATCLLLQRRARLSPAMDSDGKPVLGVVDHQVRWSLPN